MTEDEAIKRWLLADNFGDDRLALEHACRTIRELGRNAGFGFGRWKPYDVKNSGPKERPEPVLIEGET